MRRLPALVFVGATLVAFSALAESRGRKAGRPLVEAELVSETRGITPGGQTHLGVLVEISPGWHIYWINPGDSGQATRFNVRPPTGFTPGEVQYPAPHVFQTSEDIINYGYEGKVLFPFVLTADPGLSPGVSLPVEVEVKWLACKESCVPGKSVVALDVPVLTHNKPGRQVEVFTSTLAEVPETIPAKELPLRIDWKLQQSPLRADVLVFGGEYAEFFPLPDSDYRIVSSSQAVGAHYRELRLSLEPVPAQPDKTPSEPPAVIGVLRWRTIPTTTKPKEYHVHPVRMVKGDRFPRDVP